MKHAVELIIAPFSLIPLAVAIYFSPKILLFLVGPYIYLLCGFAIAEYSLNIYDNLIFKEIHKARLVDILLWPFSTIVSGDHNLRGKFCGNNKHWYVVSVMLIWPLKIIWNLVIICFFGLLIVILWPFFKISELLDK